MPKNTRLIFIFCIMLLAMPLVSAGVGIKWNQESLIVNEGEKACMTYSVYNPWPEESYVTIELSDELKSVLTIQEAETKLVPANTPSSSAIPVKFCFKIPKVYEKDCWISEMLCKQECNEEQKIYDGEVLVKSVPSTVSITGSGGSTTQMAVSAPLRLKISCNKHGRDFTLIYAIIAVLAVVIIAVLIVRKYRKPKIERDMEKLKRLKEKISKEKKSRRT
ncbi:hypothetical protein FJZ19_06140 [Candidatus Pacearchaeota archaeon]|nr:hypothetical protein [Candidatus Pacearchaeota archaeon]